jgi:four helix bundle protein
MNPIKDKSFAFAVRIVKLNKHLTETYKEYVLSKQLLRSGTSVGANIREAHNAESDADFIHKLGIAQKECDESCYWLELLLATEYLNQAEFDSIHQDAVEILKIIKSAILTKKKNAIKHKIKSILPFLFF